MYDVIIIGAGVSGSAIARELSRYQKKIAVLEKASDVCEGTSKANSGIVHAGYDALPGTLKAKLNVAGNAMMEELAEKLDFPFQRRGSYVICMEEAGRERLQELYDRGVKNGVKGLEIVSGDEARKREPNLSQEVLCALYAPTAGIVCPFHLNYALAENAAVNGVEFFLNTEVTDIVYQKEEAESYFQIFSKEQMFEARVIVNAAGVYADTIHNMVAGEKLHITPRRGEYCLLDKAAGNTVKSTIFQLPSSLGKGVLVTPTVHGNLLVGPTAEDVDGKEEVNTTGEGLSKVWEQGSRSVCSLNPKQVITSFAGLRAHGDRGDFIIEALPENPAFFDVAGIESPGLSAAPAIGTYVADMVLRFQPADKKEHFIETRKGITNMALADEKEREQLIRKNPAYANVICRCELVTEGEILDAIHRPLGATTLDGIKRRTRTGMGRCQAGFCAPKTVEILARELGKDMSEITKHGEGSQFLTGFNKDAGKEAEA